jgi:hypothetical protein
MKSPACTQCRWGTGTTKDRESQTDAAKEMKARLAAVMAERDRQDCMWLEPKLGAKPSDASGTELVKVESSNNARPFYATSDSSSK